MIKFYFSILRYLKKKKFDRHVSLGDLIFDRKNTAAFYGFGEETTCYNNALILGDVKIGKQCWIGPNTVIDGTGGLEIGNNCTISAGVHIYTHSSIEPNHIKYQKVKIGRNTYIGPNSVIQMGVNIGDNVIIGALSFVNKDIPEGGKWLGNSMKNILCS
jgi:acetyltransferase-like isoleucine patch superfamily enzyme